MLRLAAFALSGAACCAVSLPAQAPRPDSSGTRAPRGVLAKVRLDPSREMAFEAAIVPETVYVGQQATYQVGVFLSDEIRARLRRNPEFVPPEVRSMLAFDLPSPPGATSLTAGARHYDVHIFQRALFPLTAGTQLVPSARLNYALPLSNSFFAREESHSERTGVLQVVAVSPPEAGRPDDYRGAVGRLTLSSHLQSRRAQVGDPLTLTVSVNGTGNVTLLPRPELQVPWADVVPGDERVQIDTTVSLLRGRKDFDWVVTPRRAGALSIPALRYVFFNPYTERYEIALAPAETLRVAPGGTVAAEQRSVQAPSPLPIRRLYAGQVPEPVSTRSTFWIVLALSPLPALLLAVRRRPVRHRTPTHERTLRTLASASHADPTALRRAYAAAVAARIIATPAAMSNHLELVRALRRAGVSRETARDADQLLAELDAVVFGKGGEATADAARRARAIVRAIDVEARSRSDLLARTTRVATVLLFGVALRLGAAEVDTIAARAFADGVGAYDAQDFSRARTTFFDLAKARPRAADAWINFGTASWQMRDTAAAVVGWQRAARLQPMALDTRQRLVLAPGFRDGPLGDIPPVSLDVIAALGAAAWIAGWLVIALRRRNRRRGTSEGGVVLIAIALVLGLAGLAQRDILEGRHAAVVVSRARLRGAPALGEEAGAETITGEVARVIGRQGAWSRLRLSDGREGWVESRLIERLGVE